ncbi:MAG: DUF3854 domain-containing protein [Alphaproteobacteria bacterium]|nr:DUF3854 domain-containing protein [Alphaproteobacteria bacterium]
MTDSALTNSFNVQNIPVLDNTGREAVKGSELVILFDRDTNTATVVDSVIQAQQRTGIRSFLLVSRNRDTADGVSCQRTWVTTPYWSGDSFAAAQESGRDPMDVWKEEFSQEIATKWDGLCKPAAMNDKLSLAITINSEMSADDIKEAARVAAYQAIEAQAEAWVERVERMKRGRAFGGEADESLVHRALSKTTENAALVNAFAYVKANYDYHRTAKCIVAAAQTLGIPAGAEFNGRPLIALPADDGDASIARSKQVAEKLEL